MSGIVGVWDNSTAYTAGQKVIDAVTNDVYRVLTTHTSPATPTTFATDRTNNPNRWSLVSAAFAVRGAWTTATAYAIGDIAYDTAQGVAGVCIVAHTSTTDMRTDKAAGKWSFIIDVPGALIAGLASTVYFFDSVDTTKSCCSQYLVLQQALQEL